MANRTPTPPRMSRRGRYVLVMLVGAIVLLSVLGWLVSLRTDYLWYDSVGYTEVFSTMMWTRLGLFGAFTLAMAAWCGLNLYLAYRFRPDTWPATSEQEGLERYRELISPRAGWWIGGVAVVVGIFAGMSAQSRWETWLLFRNGGDFGWTDPVLDMDAGFYVFELPFWQFLIGFGFAAVVVGILASLSAYYLYGALRFSGTGDRMTNVARIHLSVLVALFLGLKAVAYYFDRFDFTTQENPVTDIVGGGYTEMTALMNAKNALIWVSVIAAVVILIFSWGFTRSLALPAAALGLVVVTAIAAGGIYPAVVRNFQVEPNRPQREGPYAQHTIDGTRYAYGMEDLETGTYQVSSTPDAQQLADPDSLPPTEADPAVPNNDNPTINNVRLIDPFVVSDAFTQAQQPRSFYDFNEKLDIDRYTYTDENGEEVTQDFVVGLRELNPSQLTDEQQDWTVAHTVYTHGWGFVSASTTESDSGAPCFTSGVLSDDAGNCQIGNDIIEVDKPQIYYGLLNNEYAIVGVPEDQTPREYDRPIDVAVSDEDDAEVPAEEIGDDRYTTYEGDGGVDIGSIGQRLLYAWEFQEPRFLLSDQINEESQLLYNRNVRDRVQEVAPFLTVEADPYPAVVDGEIVWIVDGYTTTNDFPYSDRVNLAEATNDSYSGQGVANQASEEINYIRSSVKAVVNAYDGSVTLYAWDDEDPILEAWQKVYPSTVEPISEMSADLMSHVRYPTDLFKVQREILGVYHVDTAGSFAQQDNRWQTPNDPRNENQLQPPYYLSMQMPGQDSPRFSMFSTFIPSAAQGTTSRNVLMGYLAVDSDAGSTAGEKAEGYGQLNMLEIDADTTVPGPGQVQNTFNSDPAVVQQLNLLQQGESEVQYGNLLTLPVGGGLLYVQPVYVQSSEGTQLPLLQKVLVTFGDSIAFEDTLTAALDVIFGGDSGASGGDEEVEPVDPGDGTDPPEEGTTDPGTTEPDPGTGTDARAEALADAQQALTDREAALKAGDLTAFAEADKRLTAAITELLALESAE